MAGTARRARADRDGVVRAASDGRSGAKERWNVARVWVCSVDWHEGVVHNVCAGWKTRAGLRAVSTQRLIR